MKKAVLAAIELPGQNFSPTLLMEELSLLLENLGIATVGTVVQKRGKPDPAFLLGKGKVEEAALFCRETGADLLVCNESLSPGQKSNLQSVVGIEVWDRPFVIMKIFEKRARTSEAKLQVEMALCRYEIPHLKGLGVQMSRLGGGIGTRGPGETEFEIHRRRLERRIRDIGKKLRTLKRKRELQRARRRKMRAPVVSLVGYTNSGKSSLLRALSGDSSLIVEDRLFTTLDTFIRSVFLSSGRNVLVSDTVGFIRDLPPGLVAAFRTTLEEITGSDLLLIVIDVSAPDFLEVRDVVEQTLYEIGAGDTPRLFVLNKMDLVSKDDLSAAMARLGVGENQVFGVCTLDKRGLPELRRALARMLDNTEGEPA